MTAWGTGETPEQPVPPDRSGEADGPAPAADGQRGTGVGVRVATLRERAGLTRGQLAGRLDVPVGWVAKVEAGRAVVGSHSLASRLARVLGCGTYTLLAGPDPGPAPPRRGPEARARPGRPLAADSGPDALSGVLDLVVTADLGLPLEAADAWGVAEGRRELDRVAETWRAGRLGAMTARLPALVYGLQAGVEHARDGSAPAGALLARAYLAAASLLAARGCLAGAHLAVRHGTRAAVGAGEEVTPFAGRLLVMRLLAADGLSAEAAILAERALGEMQPLVVAGTPEALSVYGSMHLVQAVVAGEADRPDLARAHLDEAAEAAARLGDDQDHLLTLFGPSAVAVARMTVAAESGDIGRGLQAARRIDPVDIRFPAVRARYWCEAARIAAVAGRPSAALEAAERADEAAPDVARADPLTRHVVDYLASMDALGYRGRLGALTTDFWA